MSLVNWILTALREHAELAFFLTPIMWRKEMLGRYQWAADFNPLYHLIAYRGTRRGETAPAATLLSAPDHIVPSPPSWLIPEPGSDRELSEFSGQPPSLLASRAASDEPRQAEIA
jgi:hypothetical protein